MKGCWIGVTWLRLLRPLVRQPTFWKDGAKEFLSIYRSLSSKDASEPRLVKIISNPKILANLGL
jgi:hypothetical protein